MENKTNETSKSGKKEKILKGAAYVGAAGAGALGTMAFTTPEKAEEDAQINSDDANDIVVETNDDSSSHVHSQQRNDNDTIVAELTDEQIAELKEDLREEIKQELLNDENFIQEVREEIVAELDLKPTTDPEIEVLDYATVTAPDGSTADVATVKIEGTHVAMIDVDQDDYADIAVVDTNNNQQIDPNDTVYDVSDQGIAMHGLCEAVGQSDEELLSGDNAVADSSDYVNDADTTEFQS